MTAQFGWALASMSTPNGLPVERATYPQSSAAYATCSLFDTTGAPYTPVAGETLQYRIDDVTAGNDIASWTAVPNPTSVNQVTVTGADNALQSVSRDWETHQVMFQFTTAAGAVFYAPVRFEIRAEFTPLAGESPWPSSVDADAPAL